MVISRAASTIAKRARQTPSAAGFFARVVLHGPVDRRSLAVSVGLVAGAGLEPGDDPDACVRRPAPRR